MKIPSAQLEFLRKIVLLGEEQNISVYLVGGVIRDTLLGRPSLDFDLMVEGDGIAFAKEVAKEFNCTFKDHPQFLTAKLQNLSGGIQEMDIATAREEKYPVPGALPEVKSATITNDLNRRDFTINAMCILLKDFLDAVSREVSLRPLLIDPFNGCLDLDNKFLRILHERSFIDDPTRIFRGARYAARIGGTFEQVTLYEAREAINNNALSTVSFFRIGNELKHIVNDDTAENALNILYELGVFRVFGFPETQDLSKIYKIFSMARTAAEKANVKFPKIELPLLIYLLTEGTPSVQREKVFMDWGFGKKGIAKIAAALKNFGVMS